MAIPVGIVGFRGYSGAEAVRILEKHPDCEPVLLEHRVDAGHEDSHPRRYRPRTAHADPKSVAAEGLKAVLLATPHDVAMDLAPQFLDAGVVVVDLSAAFRLGTAERYKRWYREDHTAASLLPNAVYSIPEFHRAQVKGAKLIANPGCYPTAANLAIRPLVKAGVIDLKCGIVCDAKSGVSGAGRKATLSNSFCEVTENFRAYSIMNHRHVPEVLEHSGIAEGEFTFTAQLIPIDRGILETIYFRLAKPLTSEEIVAIYDRAYEHEPFVRPYAAGKVPQLHTVQRTNFCDIGVVSDPATGRCVVVSAIDNLGKGAAGQAIQNMNLALGLSETAGLL
jgi:N-acetyl-gamma-glutamyl-phosphate reductase